MATERLQKILSQLGIASRRAAEAMIREGSITINGRPAKLGDKADLTTDAVKVNGKLLRASQKQERVCYAFFKPKGVISMITDDAEGRTTIKHFLDTKKNLPKAKLFPVGRLDFNGEGIVLLTNDGDLAERLQKSDKLPRVYKVKIKGHPTEADLAKILKGAKLENKLVRPSAVHLTEKLTSKSQIEITFLQSGAVDVRAFLQTKGFLAEKITRIALGGLSIAGMKTGDLWPVSPKQVEKALLAYA
ncbi:MAG: pseudouridine synthase [Bacteriovoracia bacterium]